MYLPGVIAFLAVVPLKVVIDIWFWRRIHLHPLKDRSPYLVLVMNLCALGVAVLGGAYAYFWNDFPCMVSVWLTTPLLNGVGSLLEHSAVGVTHVDRVKAFLSMTMRATILLFRFEARLLVSC
jgi:hypothetical protein